MSFRTHMSNRLGKHEVKELQQTATLRTAHTHIAESTDVKVQ